MTERRMTRMACTAGLTLLGAIVGGTVSNGTYEPELGGVCAIAAIGLIGVIIDLRPGKTTTAPHEGGRPLPEREEPAAHESTHVSI